MKVGDELHLGLPSAGGEQAKEGILRLEMAIKYCRCAS